MDRILEESAVKISSNIERQNKRVGNKQKVLAQRAAQYKDKEKEARKDLHEAVERLNLLVNHTVLVEVGVDDLPLVVDRDVLLAAANLMLDSPVLLSKLV